MTTYRQLSRPLRVAIAAPWALLAVALTAATPGIRQLLLDATNKPTSNISLSSAYWIGTLDPARLPATVPLLADLGSGSPIDLDIDGAILQNGNLLAYQGVLFYQGGAQQITDANTLYTPNGNVLADNLGYLYGDGSNLTNVQVAGLSLGDGGGSIGVDVNQTGDFYVDGTQLLSGPNTLGPLDGSALAGYAPSFTANVANYANYSGYSTFDEFFHPASQNTDTSLPGDGTASFSNGQFLIGSDGSLTMPGSSGGYAGFFSVDPANGQIYIGDYTSNVNGTRIQLDDGASLTTITNDLTVTGSLTVQGGIIGSTGTSTPMFTVGSAGATGTSFYPHVTGGVLTFTATP